MTCANGRPWLESQETFVKIWGSRFKVLEPKEINTGQQHCKIVIGRFLTTSSEAVGSRSDEERLRNEMRVDFFCPC